MSRVFDGKSNVFLDGKFEGRRCRLSTVDIDGVHCKISGGAGDVGHTGGVGRCVGIRQGSEKWAARVVKPVRRHDTDWIIVAVIAPSVDLWFSWFRGVRARGN